MASVRNRSSPAADVVKPFYFQDILEQEKPLDTPWKKLTSKYIIHLVNISVILWQSVLLVEETVVSGENHQQTLSHNVVSSTPRQSRFRTQHVSGVRN
jgi:hypothetical protein